MGAPMTRHLARPMGRSGGVTPLLRFLAGEHSKRIASVWPAPHAGFLALPAARRHAAAILLDRNRDDDEAIHAVEFARDADVAHLIMQGEGPPGLMRVLSRMDETLWNAADYDLLLTLFADGNIAHILRHTDEVRLPRLRMIERLPAQLRLPLIIAHIPDSPGAAEDLADAFRLVLHMRGPAAALAIVERWNRAIDAARLFDMAADDLQPTAFGGLLQPPVLPQAFVPVTDRKMLERVALEFRNCLRDFISDIAAGRMAVYVLRDGVERAVLALRQDPAGWRLAEARGPDNRDLGEPTLRFIVEAVERAGGRTGESVWSLGRRLHEHVCPRCGPAHAPGRETWEDRLMLGSLWD